MRLLLNHDALYLCTNIIWGGPGLDSAVTLWINRNGQGGDAPGPADLRLRLLPDGALEVGTGDGRGYNGPAPALLASRVVSGTTFALQEDLYPVNSPWWAGEVRIPLAALAPFSPGDPLRFALAYEGTAVPGALPEGQERFMGGWPASFDPVQPGTWGEASTEKPPHVIYLPSVSRREGRVQTVGAVGAGATFDPAPATGGLIVIAPERVQDLAAQEPGLAAGWPRQPPTVADFDNHCDAVTSAVYAVDKDYKWPRVDPQNFPNVQADGALSSIKISSEDSPFIHDSHDLDMKMSVRQEDRWLMLNGESSLVLETESGPFDARAMPVPGDHVTAQGRWIFDCGHAPKTEIHPIPIFESDRLVTLPDGIGIPGNRKTVRVARVWMNSQPGAFGYTLGGPFTFSLELPSPHYNGDKLLYLRVVEGPADKVAVTGLTSTKAQITITPPSNTGKYYFELMLGYLDTPKPVSAGGLGYRVTLDKIWIYEDYDSGWPDCGPWDDPHDCGEWYMDVAFDDSWRKVFVNREVGDSVKDKIDVNISYPVSDSDLHLRVIGYEDDDGNLSDIQNNFKGEVITSGEWNLGKLSELCCGVQRSVHKSDWRIFYTVHDDYDGLTALPPAHSVYWAIRLANEPNDPMRYDLGTLPMPAEGAPAHISQKNSYLTQSPLQKDGVAVLSSDADRYQFALSDLADVTFGSLPSGLHLSLDKTFPWTYAGELPPLLANQGLYKSAWLSVHGDSLAVTDKPYTLKVNTTWRSLPGDWGESQDTFNLYGVGGRLVDLVTPDPATQEIDFYFGSATSRTLTKDWAWQHVQGDVDYYDVWILPISDRPPDLPPTGCDTPKPASGASTACAVSGATPATTPKRNARTSRPCRPSPSTPLAMRRSPC